MNTKAANLGSSEDAIGSLECLSPFTPSRWWRGGWLQTISIKAIRVDLDSCDAADRAPFEIRDQSSPPDTLRGFYLAPRSSESSKATVVLFHGMGGHAQSGYMQSLACTLLANEFPVILWNHRGAGDSGSECSNFHHPGCIEDIELLIGYLRNERSNWIAGGINLAGFSLGANPMLRYLAANNDDCLINAAVSISAPLDMEITSRNLRKGVNRLFDKYLLKRQRDELLRQSADLSTQERETIEAASSVWELDDQFTAKRYGYSGAKEYYRENSACYVLDDIRTPTLLLHAEDDPVVDMKVFRQRDWADEGPLYAALVESGGHTGFLDREGRRWHERSAVDFFDWIAK